MHFKKRISNIKRCALLRAVLFENNTIKQASVDLGINYSSAKSIVNSHKKGRRGQFKIHKQQEKLTDHGQFIQSRVKESSDGCKIQILISLQGNHYSQPIQAGYRQL